MRTIPLTSQQLKVLQAINRTITVTGGPPTYAQLANRVGLSSLATVSNHLVNLSKKGMLTWKYNQRQSMKITRRGMGYIVPVCCPKCGEVLEP